MKETNKAMVLIFTMFILMGCSTTRYSVPGNFKADDFKSECPDSTLYSTPYQKALCESRAFASKRASFYREKYTGIQTETSWIFDVPLIAIASGATAALLFEGPIDLIKGLGLAGATWAGYKAYFYNMQSIEYLIKAEEANLCVKSRSDIYQDSSNKSIESIEQTFGRLNNDVSTANKLMLQDNFDKSSDEFKSLSAIVVIANSAINQYKKANTNIINAPDNIKDLVRKIDSKVSKYLATNSADVNEIIRQVKESAKSSVEEEKKREKTELALQDIRKSNAQLSGSKYFLAPDDKLSEAERLKKRAVGLTSALQDSSKTILEYSKPFIDTEASFQLCVSSL